MMQKLMNTSNHDTPTTRFNALLEYHMGPILKILEDKTINDLAINPNGEIFSYHSNGEKKSVNKYISPKSLRAIGTILASSLKEELNEKNPSLAAVYPNPPIRLHFMIPTSVTDAALTIRRFAPTVFPLESFIEKEICTKEQAELLRHLVRAKKNIIVSGETGSGKTTLINTLIQEIPDKERLYIIEDTSELVCLNPDKIFVHCSTEYTQRQAVKDALRFFPDRIIVGEVRDGAALDLIQAWNTGHPGGLCTIHANSASSVKLRLKSLVEQVSATSQKELIDEAVDAIVQISLIGGTRKITEIIEYKDKAKK